MMTETGRVVAVDQHAVWVEVIQQSTCGSCSAQKACGQSLLQKLYQGRHHRIQVFRDDQAPEQIQIGDQVTIGLPEAVIVRGSLVLYILPLLGLLLGAVIGQALFESGDLSAIIGAALGFLCGIFVAKKQALIQSKDPATRPRLISRTQADYSSVALSDDTSF